ncbi:MAG: hypothetical protein A2623_07790 [Caulobacterales bacterium RIFCSPHIGHO2_01_FULL_70_19]|nr:MAG: hypothetical protein A2623_07790 [Caulobacterales bacterium RIFCSPHIGHO2_01_FULL_70_19]
MTLSRSHIEFASFTPAEAAAITGVQQGAQRDWRRRGALPKSEGWAKFTSLGLIEIALRKTMGEMGMPHVEPSLDLHEAVLQAQTWAATASGAVAFEDGLDAVGEFPMGPPTARYAWASFPWQSKLELKLLASLADLQSAIDREPRDGVVLIDLKALGLQIATRAGEPLWKVKRGPDPAELIAALNRASAGDLEAQSELARVGIFDWKVVQN